MTTHTDSSTIARTPVDEAIVIETVERVWSTLLGTVATPTPPEPIDGTTASISIAGPWTATITMTMGAAAVASCASKLFGLDPDELDDSLRADAIGEIVNVVGGNIKSLVDTAEPTTLSLPMVSTALPDVVGARIAVEVGFDVDGDHVLWRVHDSRR